MITLKDTVESPSDVQDKVPSRELGLLGNLFDAAAADALLAPVD
jgi:hypothetical protein